MPFDFYSKEDQTLEAMLKPVRFLDGLDVGRLSAPDGVSVFEVHRPDDEYGFLHEAAIIEYHGVLFASWYTCPLSELHGVTPVRGRRSRDGGRTWSDVEVIDTDESGKILFCPPVYGICDDRLFMLINEMVAPDHIHALNLYVFDEADDCFKKLWSRPIPFKLNTNVYALPNGKLMLPGRIAELDGFPNTPAVLISDSGKIDAPWRLVRIQPDGGLPDGSKLVHPELSAIVDGERVIMFSRDDERKVPLVYLSDDCAEHWSGPFSHDIPFSNSKIYSGTLTDGRHYVVGNLYPDRSRLAILFTRPGETVFSSGMMLQDGPSAALGYGEKWHYPVACEAAGRLYVIYTVTIREPRRGAVVSVIPLN